MLCVADDSDGGGYGPEYVDEFDFEERSAITAKAVTDDASSAYYGGNNDNDDDENDDENANVVANGSYVDVHGADDSANTRFPGKQKRYKIGRIDLSVSCQRILNTISRWR